MIRIGCQTYSWQMSLEHYQGRIDHIAAVVGKAGFGGLESEVVMLGAFTDSEKLRSVLASAGLELAALTLVEDWAATEETPAERAEADAAIDLARELGALFVLCQMPGRDRSNLEERQARLLSCLGAVGERAAEAGLVSAFHPNSPEGSVFRTEADYSVLLEGLPETVGFAPDLGHIARGGMDALELVRRTRPRIRHVHAKDMSRGGRWVPIGEGVVPVKEVAAYLRDTGYEGWLVLEDESELAERDPDAATAKLGIYVEEVLAPILGARREEGQRPVLADGEVAQ
jgi:inosose dehydratase